MALTSPGEVWLASCPTSEYVWSTRGGDDEGAGLSESASGGNKEEEA